MLYRELGRGPLVTGIFLYQVQGNGTTFLQTCSRAVPSPFLGKSSRPTCSERLFSSSSSLFIFIFFFQFMYVFVL
ncbi:hypothetical protein HOLleu_35519 [Holothuria leucospilota]|uniref:Uncharacterized protein n=1 Tax=Holothuria leucospilota TaxID=206669 RepID=A0A9Q0YT63_HOLLE|nr:hypothetical protein HOLleu_35519 [Holothuria leucospilota]